MDEINPYAPPKSTEWDEFRYTEINPVAWRDGDRLMVMKDAILPDRCVKCNESAEGFQFKRSLTWGSPSLLIFILCGLLPFLVLYVLLSKKGRVTVGVCPLHRQERKKAITRGWLIALAGLTAIVVSGALPDNIIPIAALGGFGLILTGLILGSAGSRILVPARIDKQFIWLTKLSPVYLASFPNAQLRSQPKQIDEL
jgi:hypothetical protein